MKAKKQLLIGKEDGAQDASSRSNWGYHISIKIMLVVVTCAMLLSAACGTLLLLAGSEFGLLTMNRTDFRHSIYEMVADQQLRSRQEYLIYTFS